MHNCSGKGGNRIKYCSGAQRRWEKSIHGKGGAKSGSKKNGAGRLLPQEWNALSDADKVESRTAEKMLQSNVKDEEQEKQ